MRADKKTSLKSDKKAATRSHKRGVVGYSKKTALLEDAITQMNAGKYGRSSAALKELLALDPHNMEARRLFATLHLRLGSLIPARQAFDSLINEAFERQDYWLAESLLREYLAAGPRCVPFLEKLGSIYQEKGDALEAVTEYGKAIDILIEDPDTDNPAHASQLYAKIRELAPASPIAFRLASFFDAQTGAVVVHPPVAHGEAALATPVSPVGEDTPIGLSIPEPTAAVMPWEQVDDSPGASGVDRVQESTRPSESLVSSMDTSILPQAESLSSDVSLAPISDLSAVERNEIGLDTQTETGVESPDAIRITEAVEAPDALEHEDKPSLVRSSESVVETPTTLPESDLIATRVDDAVCLPTLSLDRLDSPLPQSQEEAVAGVVSAPMPWEDVQESTISIPDHGSDVSPVPSTPAEAVSGASFLETESSVTGQDESPDVAPSPPVFVEPSQSVPVTEASTATPAEFVPDQSPAAPLPEGLKGGGFSWESVFSSAWKFGDKPSRDTPQPEDAQADTIQIEESPAPTVFTQLAQAPESVDIPETYGEELPADSTAAASVAAPMPWDQVQESIITIPPAEVEDTGIELPREQSVQSASPVEPVPAMYQEPVPEQALPQSFNSPSCNLLGTDTFSTSQPPPAPPSPEPDLRLASVPLARSVQEDQSISAEKESPPFTIAVSVPTAEVVSTALKYVELAPQQQEETIEPVSMAPSPFSTSVSAPAVEVAPTEAQPEERSFSFQDQHVEPGSAPQAVAPEPLAESAQDPSRTTGELSNWKTGEVEVQSHRPSSKKRKRAPAPASEIPDAPLSSEETSHRQAAQSEQQEAAFAEARARIPEPVLQQEKWMNTGESSQFIEQPHDSPVVEAAPEAPEREKFGVSQSVSTAASAVDVLFESSGHFTRTGAREHVAEPTLRPRVRSRLNRIRIGISIFISSCFSTTRAIVMSLVALVALSGALLALGIGAVGLMWIIMEKQPSPVFQSLTTSPQRTLSDLKKNGYLLLLGFDAPAGQDPMQAGYERKPDATDASMALACLGGFGGGAQVGQSNASANVANGWFRGSDPVGQFKLHESTIKGWVSQGGSALDRYTQWQKLSFEDWGYGQTISPPCASIVFAHHLYLADGFVEGADIGVDRLETDMEAWRIALGQAKTLPVKTLALQAINDNIAVASGLLVRPDFDGKYLGRVTKILRPLDQVELSIRWPMQSELVSATKTFEAQLKAERGEEPPLHAVVASSLPLPKQRRFNDYAEYYEASYKAAGEGRYGSLPKWKNYIRFPANTVMDYLTNPIENIVGLEPLAPWDLYSGLVVDTDAHLRLASLQAWLRRGSQDADLLARIAKAGQNFYDPYTGLPMLVNLKKGVVYSVGHDGKDQDADPQSDVVVRIPVNQAPAAQAKPPAGSPKSR